MDYLWRLRLRGGSGGRRQASGATCVRVGVQGSIRRTGLSIRQTCTRVSPSTHPYEKGHVGFREPRMRRLVDPWGRLLIVAPQSRVAHTVCPGRNSERTWKAKMGHCNSGNHNHGFVPYHAGEDGAVPLRRAGVTYPVSRRSSTRLAPMTDDVQKTDTEYLQEPR